MRSRQATKLAGAMTFRCVPPRLVSQTVTSRSGSRYGSGSSITVRTTLKIAEVAPMPRASVTSAAAVKPGARRSTRTPWRRSRSESSSSAGRNSSRVLSLTRSSPPNLTQRLAARLVGAHAGAAVLLGLLIDVEANLFVEPALERVAALTDRSEPLPAVGDPAHHASQLFSVASSTRLTARDMRRHCASSSLKCRRPARVSA